MKTYRDSGTPHPFSSYVLAQIVDLVLFIGMVVVLLLLLPWVLHLVDPWIVDPYVRYCAWVTK